MKTELVTIAADAPETAVLERAAALLKAGEIVAFPTETFYGLGVAALDAGAARRLVRVKGRPEGKPVPVLVAGEAMLRGLVSDVPARARTLMREHWPGPLTLVLRAAAAVPEAVTGGTGTVGVRVSSHAVARALPAAAGGPVTAPSANPSGAPPPTTAADVVRYFDGLIALVLDGGPTAGGRASTVLDVTVDPPRVIRPGPVSV
jgi:L-threonylcarbamoyladenylate synthase